MKIENKRINGAAVVSLEGDLNYGTHSALKKAVEEIYKEECGIVVIDLSQVPHVDSMGIGTMVHLWRSGTELKKQLRIAAPNANTARLIHLVNLDGRIPVYPSVEESLG